MSHRRRGFPFLGTSPTRRGSPRVSSSTHRSVSHLLDKGKRLTDSNRPSSPSSVQQEGEASEEQWEQDNHQVAGLCKVIIWIRELCFLDPHLLRP